MQTPTPARLELFLVASDGRRYRVEDAVVSAGGAASDVGGAAGGAGGKAWREIVPLGTRSATSREFRAEDGALRVYRFTRFDMHEIEVSCLLSQLSRAQAG